MIDKREQSRFEREENGARVVALYRRDRDILIIRHVEADPILRGTGAADRLMRDIADLARNEAVLIKPLCGYAAAWLKRNARDLIASH